MSVFNSFSEIWLVDFEFSAPVGERPNVVCLVAWELNSKQKIRVWADDLGRMKVPPYAIGDNSLVVAYYASAEMGCHLVLGWPTPSNVLDLFTEFRNLTNGLRPPCGNGLLGALSWFGLSAIDTAEKDSMRELVISGGPWSSDERTALLDYCETDVAALSRLLPAMSPELDMERALLRGRYMVAAARIEYVGIPIDVKTLELLRANWINFQTRLIEEVDAEYGVFDNRRFVQEKFAKWLQTEGIPWPRLDSGRLDLSDATFRERSLAFPRISDLRELRVSLSQMRLTELAVGRDGRNRCLLSAFRSRTGRNQPSNSRFIFGPSVWLRGLIKPKECNGIAYIDWSQQEFGIAAALSGDKLMLNAYETGDPYLAFAKQAGAVPPDATKASHKSERDKFKACVLAVQYGMGAKALARRIGQPEIAAKLLLDQHRRTYRDFWRWSDAAVDYAMLHGEIQTVFGWRVRTADKPNPRFLRNFPMQANGAEMLRLACCLATEAGISVCAPVHDAILIEAPLSELDEAIEAAQEQMRHASEMVLDGFQLRTDVDIVRSPDRYQDERGRAMWQRVQKLLASPHELAPPQPPARESCAT